MKLPDGRYEHRGDDLADPQVFASRQRAIDDGRRLLIGNGGGSLLVFDSTSETEPTEEIRLYGDGNAGEGTRV